MLVVDQLRVGCTVAAKTVSNLSLWCFVGFSLLLDRLRSSFCYIILLLLIIILWAWKGSHKKREISNFELKQLEKSCRKFKFLAFLWSFVNCGLWSLKVFKQKPESGVKLLFSPSWSLISSLGDLLSYSSRKSPCSRSVSQQVHSSQCVSTRQRNFSL